MASFTLEKEVLDSRDIHLSVRIVSSLHSLLLIARYPQRLAPCLPAAS